MRYFFFLIPKKANKAGRCPVFIRFRQQGAKPIDISTKVFVYQANWDVDLKLCTKKEDNYTVLNDTLKSWDGRIKKLVNQFELAGTPYSLEMVKNKLVGKVDEGNQTLLDAFDYYIKKVQLNIGQDYKASSLKRYLTVRGMMVKFLADTYKRKDMHLTELKPGFLADFDDWIAEKRPGELCNNTRVRYIIGIKTVLNAAVTKGWILKNPFDSWRGGYKYVKVMYLIKEEVKKIEALDLIAVDSMSLDRVKDLFLFSCYCGLAYADIMTLQPANFVIGIDGGKWIEKYREKTKFRISVPLLPKAIAILDKYNYELPKISNQKLNTYLKIVADLAGVKKHITFHMARHTAATTFLTKGVSLSGVAKALGHSSERTTERYAKVEDSKQALEFGRMMANDAIIKEQERLEAEKKAKENLAALEKLKLKQSVIKKTKPKNLPLQ